jgi:hypothetical protein
MRQRAGYSSGAMRTISEQSQWVQPSSTSIAFCTNMDYACRIDTLPFGVSDEEPQARYRRIDGLFEIGPNQLRQPTTLFREELDVGESHNAETALESNSGGGC